MHAVILGGSRGCGYFTAYYLLSAPDAAWTVTLLLRDTSVIEKDERLAPYVKKGQLQLVKGDATIEADVRRVLTGGKVDLVVSSIGKSAASRPSVDPGSSHPGESSSYRHEADLRRRSQGLSSRIRVERPSGPLRLRHDHPCQSPRFDARAPTARRGCQLDGYRREPRQHAMAPPREPTVSVW